MSVADTNPDAVKEARRLLAASNAYTLRIQVRELLGTLADEVEQLRMENKQLKKCDHCERDATQTVCDLHEGR